MLLSVLLLGIGCGPKMPEPQSMSIVPSSSVYLRNSFDMDPSSYIGRFVTDGEQSLDEASGMAMSCSKYITHRFVEGGGVKYNEVLNVSTNVGARLGVPLIGSAKGGYGSTGVVRVQYELTGKMLSEINDPDKFRDCCTEYPDQCTRRYIGEFLQGKGVVYTEAVKGANGAVEAVDPGSGVEGELSFSHGKNWKRGIEFPNPVYFAFKVNQTPYNELSQCENWMSRVPQSDKGRYFVGISSTHSDENKARKDAQKKAQEEAMRSGAIRYDGAPVQLIPEDWCMETSFQGGAKQYKAKVLVLVPKTEVSSTPPVEPTNTDNPQVEEKATTPQKTEESQNSEGEKTTTTSGNGNTTFLALLSRIKSTSFDSDKVKEVKASAGFPIQCAELSTLLAEFDFSKDKLDVVMTLRSHITDPQNSMVLEQHFNFDSDKKKLRDMFR